MSIVDLLACPIDGLPLKLMQNQLKCTNGHNFDIARQNYINLLPVQFKKTRHPGDNKEMVSARRAFLNTGRFQPIVDRLIELLNSLPMPESISLLDSACGEGYYLNSLQKSFSKRFSYVGLDISKFAILAASKLNKDITWIVATNKKIPMQDHKIDIVLSLFGFPVEQEYKRILKPEGYIIVVGAAEDHLLEIRRRLYPSLRVTEKVNLFNQLSLVQCFEVKTQLENLHSYDLRNLLMMTPHYFRADKEALNAFFDSPEKNITLHVKFEVYQIQSNSEY